MKKANSNIQASASGLPDIRPAAERIASLQLDDGAIPWVENGVIDPWNHIEAAMGLSVAGYFSEAERAYGFLKEQQLADGSWWGEYGNAVPLSDHTHLGRDGAPVMRDTNFCAYIATGVWHHYRASGDRGFLNRMWPTVEKAIEFVLSLQSDHGEIAWAADVEGPSATDALVSGCSSIYKSLSCAVHIADSLDNDISRWTRARTKLGVALRTKPERFDRTWEKKDRFSMDWYYPVLTGVLSVEESRARIDTFWHKFVVDGLGCKCVVDEPWVTVAESAELAMALMRIGYHDEARELLSWAEKWQDADGAYWMGYQYEERILWPEEKPSWTSAAMLLAYDGLYHLTGAANVLTSDWTANPATRRRAPESLVQSSLTQASEYT